MASEWYKVRGTQSTKPAEVDTTSSAYYVYKRRNIQWIEEKEQDTVKDAYWEYEEQKLTRDEWQFQTTAENQENIITIMEAIADMYELQSEMYSGGFSG